MNKKFKKIVSIVSALAIVASMFATNFVLNVSAATIQNHPITAITALDSADNTVDIVKTTGSESTVLESGSIPSGGTFAYDSATLTLTLTNVNLKYLKVESDLNDTQTVFNLNIKGVSTFDNSSLTKPTNRPIEIMPKAVINLDASSLVTAKSNYTTSLYGYQDLTINGNNAKLKMDGCTYYGIELRCGTLTVNDLNLSIIEQNGSRAACIFINQPSINGSTVGTIVMNNCVMTLRSHFANMAARSITLSGCSGSTNSTASYSIEAGGGLTVKDNCDLNITAVDNLIVSNTFVSIADSKIVGNSENVSIRVSSTDNGKIMLNNSELEFVSTTEKIAFADVPEVSVVMVDKNGVERALTGPYPALAGTPYLSPADYFDVNSAIAAANELTQSNYTDFSPVTAAINAVDYTKKYTQQADVDAMALAINTAVANLVLKGADYTAVDEAIANANALDKDTYVDFAAVDAAIAAVDRAKNITEQADVDAMATAINTAVDALVLKDADYTAVDEAIAKANALDKDAYVDFTAVDTAIAAVDRTKNITQQADVDKMADDINAAIDSLVVKPVEQEPTKSPATGITMSGLTMSALAFGVAALLNKKRR